MSDWIFLGDQLLGKTGNKIHYRIPNYEEKNRIKNNDKSIAALEGKNLLYDNPKVSHDKNLGSDWKHHKTRNDYMRKMMLRETYSKQVEGKKMGSPDDSLGMISCSSLCTNQIQESETSVILKKMFYFIFITRFNILW